MLWPQETLIEVCQNKVQVSSCRKRLLTIYAPDGHNLQRRGAYYTDYKIRLMTQCHFNGYVLDIIKKC